MFRKWLIFIRNYLSMNLFMGKLLSFLLFYFTNQKEVFYVVIIGKIVAPQK